MPITNRNLAAGTTLVATYKKNLYRCEVVETPEGLRYRLEDGSEHKSPSSAGSSVMGGTSCNGWRFWSVEGREEPAAKEPKPATAVKTKGGKYQQVRKAPNQKGVEDGKERWHCSACQKGFYAEAGTAVEACPEGHPREVVDELAPSA